jgi:hypothetical protein
MRKIIVFLLLFSSLAIAQSKKNKAFLRFGGACGSNLGLNYMSDPLINSAREGKDFAIYDSYHGGPNSPIKVDNRRKIDNPNYDPSYKVKANISNPNYNPRVKGSEKLMKNPDYDPVVGDKKVLNPKFDTPKYTDYEKAHGGKDHLDLQMEALMKQFKDKDCKKEDCQTIINLPAHGYPTDTFDLSKAGFKDVKKNHHGICMANGKKLSIEYFKPYLKELKKNGVKVAVVSEACFSGETADILGDYACVLTSTGSHIPHTTLKYRGYGQGLKYLQNGEPISMTDLAITNLMHTNAGGMLNVPIVSNPEKDAFLQKLNDASNVFTLKKQKGFINELIDDATNMSKDEFVKDMKTCVKLYKGKNGRPLETIKGEDWYQKFDKEEKDLCFGEKSYYRNISTLRNHLPELDDFDWDYFDPNDLVAELKICNDSNKSLSSLIPSDFDTISDHLVAETKTKIEGDINLVIPNFKDMFKLDDEGKSALTKAAKEKGMQCGSVHNAIAQTDDETISKDRAPTELKKCKKDQLKCCVEKCQGYIAKTEEFSDEYSMRIGAACINNMKALYLIGKQMQSDLVKNTSVVKTIFDSQYKALSSDLKIEDLKLGKGSGDKFKYGPSNKPLNSFIKDNGPIDEGTFGKKHGKAVFDILGEKGNKPLIKLEKWTGEITEIQNKFNEAEEKLKSGNFTKEDVNKYNNLVDEVDNIKTIKNEIDEYRKEISDAMLTTFGNDQALGTEVKVKKVKEKYRAAYRYLHKLGKSLDDSSEKIGTFSETLAAKKESKKKITLVDSKSFDLSNQAKSVQNTCSDVKIPPIE